MKVIYQPRGTGKTTELVKESARTRAVIVCYNPAEVHNILHLAKCLKLDVPKPIIMDQIFNHSHRRVNTKGLKLIFDDLGCMLERFVGCPIHAVSINKKEHGNE